MNRPIVFHASQVATIIGKNPYETPLELLLNTWRKTFPASYQNWTELRQRHATDIAEPILFEFEFETPIQVTDRIVKAHPELAQIITPEKLATSPESSSEVVQDRETLVRDIAEVKTVPVEKIQELQKAVRTIKNTRHGHRQETNALTLYKTETGHDVVQSQTYYSHTFNDSWKIAGYVDGLLPDQRIVVEIKNRVSRLFYELREYEKIQVFIYMALLKYDTCHLVECYRPRSASPELNIIVVPFDKKYWDVIYRRLCRTVDFLFQLNTSESFQAQFIGTSKDDLNQLFLDFIDRND